MIHPKYPSVRSLITRCCVVACLWFMSIPAFAQTDEVQRPPTEDLLPETTVAFVQIDNVREFMSKMSQSPVGQLFQDENVSPLVEELWGQAQSAYAEYEDEIGVSLEDLQSFPEGEITFAVIAPRRKSPEFMMIVETDPESEAVDRVLERGRDLVRQDGGQIDIETSDDEIEFESIQVDGNQFEFFRKDGLIVGCTSKVELDYLIDRWMGREVEKVRPLKENRKFITIMNRCLGSNELTPEARFFVDPIALAKSATRGNVGAQVTINLLPVLGLDGLLGIGGSMLLSEDEFASVAHAHILLANPRSGVFEMLAFKPTDYQPEPWLPSDVSNYFTTSWDIEQMFAELTKIIETFQGEGAVNEWIEEEINSELGFDAKEEILEALTGRVTMVQAIERPMRLNSQVAIIAIELKEPTKFEETFDKILARINREADEDEDEFRMDEEVYKGIRILGPSEDRIKSAMEKQRERQRQRREKQGRAAQVDIQINDPTPSFALVGNYFLISPQSREFVRRAIDTHQGEAQALVDTEEYQRVSRKMTGLLGTDMPSGITYARPVEVFRWMFEMAQSEETRGFIGSQAEDNEYVGGIQRALEENPLPEFEGLEKYFQPQGGFMTSDDTGLHFLVFELKSEDQIDK